MHLSDKTEHLKSFTGGLSYTSNDEKKFNHPDVWHNTDTIVGEAMIDAQ